MKIVPLALAALHDGLTLNSIASGVMTTVIAMFVIVVLRIIGRKVYKSSAIDDDHSVEDDGSWKPTGDDGDDIADPDLDATFDSEDEDNVGAVVNAHAAGARNVLIQATALSWATVVGVWDRLLVQVVMELQVTALELAPLFVVAGEHCRVRIKLPSGTSLRASDTDHEVWNKIATIWDQCRSKGCGVRHRGLARDTPWSLQAAHQFAASRVTKVLSFMSASDNRWADLAMNARVHGAAPLRVTQHTAPRAFAFSAKQSDDCFVFDNVSSDTFWVTTFCGLFMQLGMRFGATLEQARCVAAVAAIDAVAVSCGVDPNDGDHGVLPSAHGFAEPWNFPNPFHRGGHQGSSLSRLAVSVLPWLVDHGSTLFCLVCRV